MYLLMECLSPLELGRIGDWTKSQIDVRWSGEGVGFQVRDDNFTWSSSAAQFSCSLCPADKCSQKCSEWGQETSTQWAVLWSRRCATLTECLRGDVSMSVFCNMKALRCFNGGSALNRHWALVFHRKTDFPALPAAFQTGRGCQLAHTFK